MEERPTRFRRGEDDRRAMLGLEGRLHRGERLVGDEARGDSCSYT